MIPAIQGTSKLLGERVTMWSNTEQKKKESAREMNRLPREILCSFGLALGIALAGFWLLNECANRILLRYVEEELFLVTENQLIDWQYKILGFSMLAGGAIFVILFLSFVGERLAYIREVIKGIDALGRHDWGYEIPLQGKNELTELAKRVNELSKEEEAFQTKEKQLQEEKMSLIRSLSHDIRTPLTSMMSYSEFMRQKEDLTADEVKTYMELVEQKCQQIKVLTDRLLDGGSRQLEMIENGRFLMEQLVDEWEVELEDDFSLEISLEECPAFSGEFDVEELRRVFDNLVSNIRKYADASLPIQLQVGEKEGRLYILQSNKCKVLDKPVESTKIGIDSIRKIASQYGGNVAVSQTNDEFLIQIYLFEIKNNL